MKDMLEFLPMAILTSSFAEMAFVNSTVGLIYCVVVGAFMVSSQSYTARKTPHNEKPRPFQSAFNRL